MKDMLIYTFTGLLNTQAALGKKYMGFNIRFMLLCSLITGIIALVFCYYINLTFHFFGLQVDGVSDIIGSPQFIVSITELATYTSVICFGLYTAYLQTSIDSPDEKPSINKLFGSIHGSVWQTFVISFIIYLVVYFLSFPELFDLPEYSRNGILGMLDGFDPDHGPRERIFYIWIRNIVGLIKMYLPQLMVFFILLTSINKRFDLRVLKQYRKEIMVVLVLGFAWNEVSTKLTYYLDTYLLDLLGILFPDGFVVAVLQFITHVTIFAWFYVIFACTFIFPARYRMEQIKEEAPGISDQSSNSISS